MTKIRPIPEETISDMVHLIDSGWQVEDAAPIERGVASLYEVEVNTDSGLESFVLKATPEEQSAGISAEGRLMAVLSEHTSIPIPTLAGVVDDHEEFPTPYVVMESVSGAASDYQETRHLPDRVLRSIAQQTGAYLAELHAIDAADSFGRVWWTGSNPLSGGQPSPNLQQLEIINESYSWPNHLRGIVATDLDSLRTTSFADLEPQLREWTAERIASLEGSMRPVLGRIDHGIHNLIVEPETGEIRALLDWGFTLAVTPRYDFKIIEWVLSGALLSQIPGVPDRRDLVREAMNRGYRKTASTPLESAGEDDELYEAMAIIRSMNHIDARVAEVPAGSEDEIAAGLRSEARAILDRGDKR